MNQLRTQNRLITLSISESKLQLILLILLAINFSFKCRHVNSLRNIFALWITAEQMLLARLLCPIQEKRSPCSYSKYWVFAFPLSLQEGHWRCRWCYDSRCQYSLSVCSQLQPGGSRELLSSFVLDLWTNALIWLSWTAAALRFCWFFWWRFKCYTAWKIHKHQYGVQLCVCVY